MMRDRDTRLVVAHLHNAVPRSTKGGPAGLTVVAVDNAQLVAQVVVSLALSCVRQGRKVVLADLSGDARAARLLGTRSPGINAVSHNGVNLTVIVPDHDDIAPIGPLKDGRSAAMSGQPSEALAAACASADLVLTLAVLDPAFGGDHLATWATEAVAVVSAGQSSAEKVHAVGEMIRLAGTQLASVVLIGADKTDESLGVPRALDESVLATPV
jgi:hypothetical protein